jgi:hypothetical protein
MSIKSNSPNSLDDVLRHLRTFIDLSFQEDEVSMKDWISSTIKGIVTKCWEKKGCLEKNCPAYEHDCGRCWLIAGTMCGGGVQGVFAKKYTTCSECEVFKEAVFKDPATELQEHILILIHSLRVKQQELKEALDEVKTLSGLLPICSSCKKIRDDHGYWKQIDAYLTSHSDLLFSHGICPDCIKELYPEVYEEHFKEGSDNGNSKE